MRRIDSLPDGCNRLDEPYARNHINDYEHDESSYVGSIPLTKDNFPYLMAKEIKEVREQESLLEKMIHEHVG